ncbi:MAG TPA: hypothetical protein VHT04_02730, partial [Stellaceae bacterium]|nr:hypothetical protein [Stellaceae bacterium]
LALCATLLRGPGVHAADNDTRSLSPAQIALFESDHLGGIRQAERLEYRFAREAVASTADDVGSYTDRVDIDVRPRADCGKDVWTDFLSAERHVPFPPLMDFHGNPVVMFFLERDVGEMHRLTGGTASYFRNRIRQAFVDQAQVKAIELQRDGKAVPATEITLTPFAQDQHVAVFPGLAEKRYRFVLSDSVPGSIVEIQSEAPSKTGQFSTRETMTFVGEGPCTGDIGPCAPVSQQ